jgi:hypothetical protein
MLPTAHSSTDRIQTNRKFAMLARLVSTTPGRNQTGKQFLMMMTMMMMMTMLNREMR